MRHYGSGCKPSGYGGARGADRRQAIPSRVGLALRAIRDEGKGEPYDSARSLRGARELAVSNRTHGDMIGPGCDPRAGRVTSPPSSGHGSAASAALGSRPRRGERGACHGERGAGGGDHGAGGAGRVATNGAGTHGGESRRGAASTRAGGRDKNNDINGTYDFEEACVSKIGNVAYLLKLKNCCALHRL